MRPAFPALLALAIAFAGCAAQEDSPAPTSSPSPTPAAPPAPALGTPHFAPATVLGQMMLGAEPGVSIGGPNGTVYVTTPLALWRSDDGGKTWLNLGSNCPNNLPCPGPVGITQGPPGLTGGGDASIFVGADGRVHWLGLGGGIPYQYSTDQGKTWSPPVDLAGGSSSDREWITGRQDGTLFGIWRDFGRGGIAVGVSHDAGANWTVPDAAVWPDGRTDWIAVDPTSQAIGFTIEGSGNSVEWVYSHDDGKTWNSTQVAPPGGPLQNRAVSTFDQAGHLYVVWARHDAGASPASALGNTHVVHMAVSKDKGLTWSQPVQVNQAGTTGWYPWIAAGADGRIVVVWYQNDQGLPREYATTVFVMAGISLDATAESPNWLRSQVSPLPNHVGPECRTGTAASACTRSLLDFFGVAIHPAGYPIVAWAEDAGQYGLVKVAATWMDQGPNLIGP